MLGFQSLCAAHHNITSQFKAFHHSQSYSEEISPLQKNAFGLMSSSVYTVLGLVEVLMSATLQGAMIGLHKLASRPPSSDWECVHKNQQTPIQTMVLNGV